MNYIQCIVFVHFNYSFYLFITQNQFQFYVINDNSMMFSIHSILIETNAAIYSHFLVVVVVVVQWIIILCLVKSQKKITRPFELLFTFFSSLFFSD